MSSARARPHGGGVHEPVPGESAGQVEVVEAAWVVPDDHVAVEPVLVVEARGGAAQAQLVEAREAVRDGGPHGALEVTVVDAQIEAARLAEVDQAGQDAGALRPDREPGRVLDEREAV